MVSRSVLSAHAASPRGPSLSARPAHHWGSGHPPNLVFTPAAGRLPCSSFWGLAPMVRPGRSCNRAGLMPLRCLIVDDNASFREEMRGLLAEQGLDVVGGAGSAAEAFRKIAELGPDVALIDIDLGEESGLELAAGCARGQVGSGPAPNPDLDPRGSRIRRPDRGEFGDWVSGEDRPVGDKDPTDARRHRRG